jgi:hypothetical protein
MANRLKDSRSQYLRDSSSQPVNWYPYCEEAFERAEREDKPVLIDIGALWCHWCHVMDTENYSDEEVAAFLNENFICIKVDRDEMPHIDKIYQEAVSALTGISGWPLTVITTPSGKVFFGGSYFPKAKFLEILRTALHSYRHERDKVEMLAEEVAKEIKRRVNPASPAEAEERIIIEGIRRIEAVSDEVYGGYGYGQKFPFPVANLLLLVEKKYVVAEHSLTEMASGGLRDHVFGGFFRYCVDRYWEIPHFEKLLIDNAFLLMDYLLAYRKLGISLYLRTASGITEFINDFLTSNKGFYSSISADFDNEEGGFYLWSYSELEALLNKDEFNLIKILYGVTEKGNLNGKNHLRLVSRAETVADELNFDISQVEEIEQKALEKMRKERLKFKERLEIDRSVYTGYSASAVTSLLYSEAITGRSGIPNITTILKNLLKRFHDVLYREEDVEGTLEDYAYLINAIITSHYVRDQDIDPAVELFESAIKEFGEEFVDKGGVSQPFDTPNFAAIPMMCLNAAHLGHLTGEEEFRDIAARNLKKFAGLEHNLYSAGYLLALRTYLNPVVIESDKNSRPIKFISPEVIFTEGNDIVCTSRTCLPLSRVKEVVDG